MSDIKIREKTIEGIPSYAIYFDNVRVDKYVKGFDCTLYTDGNIGSATVEMIYMPDFYKIYTRGSNGQFVSSAPGIDNMTNVKIFIKNMFNNKYIMVFDGNIRGKTFSKSPSGQYGLFFTAQDYMTWLNRTITPIVIPLDNSVTPGDQLKWKAHGVDIDKVPKVSVMKDFTFKGKTLAQSLKDVTEKTIIFNKIYSDTNSVAYWDGVTDRLTLMGDIDENLRRAEVLDFIVASGATSVNSLYVMINDIIKNLMFEFYQDRDGIIRIKPPYWNQKVLYDHIIDPSLIESFTESTNWSGYFTRVVTTGAVEQWMENDENMNDEISQSIVTPIGAYVGDDTGQGRWSAYTSGQNLPPSGGNGGSYDGDVSNSAIVQYAMQFVGGRYVWGGNDPHTGADCSGFVKYVLAHFGINLKNRKSTYQYNEGIPVSANDIRPGDLVFYGDKGKPISHVAMYAGGDKIVHARNKKMGIRTDKYSTFWASGRRGIRRYISDNGVALNSGSDSYSYKGSVEVGGDSLLTPSNIERKYGVSIYDVNQPLIKFSTAGSIITDPTGTAAQALKAYSTFMFNLLNSMTEVATVQTVAMPWVRPGFNVWLDPISIDKIYYVNSISHQGSPDTGVHTNLRLAMGRDRIRYSKNESLIGGMKDGNDNVFINKIFDNYKVDKFGRSVSSSSEFDTLRSQCIEFHNNSDDTIIKADKSPYFKNFYGQSNVNTRTGSILDASETSSDKSNVSVSDIDTWPSRLAKGSKGAAVKQLQTILNKLGYSCGSVDGAFGSNTKNAVINFQRAKKISADGIVGPTTKSKLKESLLQGESNGAVSTNNAFNFGSWPTLSRGKRGKYVNELQEVLKSLGFLSIRKTTEYFGDMTYAAVKKFQASRGIAADGVVGPITKNKLKESMSNQSSNSASTSSPSSSGTVKLTGGGLFSEEYTINEIESKLNNLYSSAPNVVKERSSKIKEIMKNAEVYLQSHYIK